MFEEQELALLQSVFADRHRLLVLGESPVSLQCDERIARLPRVRHYPVRRVACLLAAVLLLISAAIVAVSGFDSKLIVETFEDGKRVTLAVEPTYEFTEARPTAIPAGYRLVEDRSEKDETYLLYEGKDGGFFCYAQYPAGNEVSLPIGDRAYEKATVADRYEAILVQEDRNTCLFFTDGTHLCLINGTLTRAECFETAASVFEKRKGE